MSALCATSAFVSNIPLVRFAEILIIITSCRALAPWQRTGLSEKVVLALPTPSTIHLTATNHTPAQHTNPCNTQRHKHAQQQQQQHCPTGEVRVAWVAPPTNPDASDNDDNDGGTKAETVAVKHGHGQPAAREHVT